MIKVSIQGKDYGFETSWNDVTLTRYCEFIQANKREKDGEIEPIDNLAVRTNIPVEILKQVAADDVQRLSDITSFVDDDGELEASSIVDPLFKDFDIGSQSWAKLEQAKQVLAINEGKPLFCSAGDLVKIYTGLDISHEKIKDVYGLCAFFLHCWQASSASLKGLKSLKIQT